MNVWKCDFQGFERDLTRPAPQAGDYQDPFKEAERRERQKELVARNKVTVIPPATKQNGFAQPTGPQGAATGGAPGAYRESPPISTVY